ncbi:hypothetical protein ILUMI_05266, partial [Ignelater luminosus]
MEYFGIFKKALRITGVSIDGHESTAYKIYSIIIYFGFITLYPILNFLKLFRVNSADEFGDVFLYATAGISGKTLVILKNRVKFGKVLNRLQQEPFLPDPNRGGENEVKIVRECLWLTNVQVHNYLLFIYKKHTDSLITTSQQMVEVSHTRKIEKSQLQDHEKETDTSTISCRYLHDTIKRAVSYHVAILNVAFDIETTFSKLLLMSFLVTLALVCISVFHMAMANNRIATLRYLFEASAAVLQVAIYCYWGEQVNQESQLVGFFAYNSNFSGTDLGFQRALALIIRRSQTPTVITAGGFTDIGLPTFFW